MTFADVLDSHIVVCAGSGGVGKTTISAAIALEAARRGSKTIVVTIDPARRLANALGLEELANKPTKIQAKLFKAAGFEPAPLEAMMLDTKTTFDQLVFKYARDERRAKSIVGNRFYQAVSGALSGTHEYMAMEKLFELHQEGSYDLIVVDTPPTRNALDFLEAPKHMTSFLEGRLLKWLLLPAIGGGRGIFRAVNFAAVTFLRVVQRIVGTQVIKDTAEFFANFEGMYEGFKERAAAVFELLKQPETSFVVVTSPGRHSVEEAVYFASTLNDYQLPFRGLIVNRVHPQFGYADLEVHSPTGSAMLDRMLEIARDFDQVARFENENLDEMKREIPERRWVRIPYLNREVADLESLSELAAHMFV